MIGGSGNRLAKIARTKSSPDIDAITSMGTMPYSIACLPDVSSMILNTPRRHAGPDPDIYDCSESIAASSSRDWLNGEPEQEFSAPAPVEVPVVESLLASL